MHQLHVIKSMQVSLLGQDLFDHVGRETLATSMTCLPTEYA